MSNDQLYSPCSSQLASMLDDAPVAVCISMADTRNIVYANKSAQALFIPVPCQETLTCYQALGLAQACPECETVGGGRPERTEHRVHSPVTGRDYQISSKQIYWAEQPARIDYISDIAPACANEGSARDDALQAALEELPCALSVLRIDGEQLAPLFHNAAANAIAGGSVEQLYGVQNRESLTPIHPDDMTCMAQCIANTVRNNADFECTCRVRHGIQGEYVWLKMDGSVKRHTDGTRWLYVIYEDVSAQRRLEAELRMTQDNTRAIVNSIPGGIAVYKVSDKLKTVYFSDGVAELSGYTVEEYRELCQQDALNMTYSEDRALVAEHVKAVIDEHKVDTFEFRKRHRDGHIVWVRVQMRANIDMDGSPLLYCVFYNVSHSKDTQFEMNHLVNSIPGGIVSCRLSADDVTPTFVSDGVFELFGYEREELSHLSLHNIMGKVYERDRQRLADAVEAALASGSVLDIGYRMWHKSGELIWMHIHGRFMDARSEVVRLYAIFNNVSVEDGLFRSMALDNDSSIYVIDKQNYELMYVNESGAMSDTKRKCIGEKCYKALYNKTTPCEFCTLDTHNPDGQPHIMEIASKHKIYTTNFREIHYNGIPAYVKYVKDVTEEVQTRRDKERLEQYFQTMVKNLSGGVMVISYEWGKGVELEFISDGFAAMLGITYDEAWALYKHDLMSGVHPDDAGRIAHELQEFIYSDKTICEMTYRVRNSRGQYIWVKNSFSLMRNERGRGTFYSNSHDITAEREQQELLRQQYNDLIMAHYHMSDPNSLMLGHCNVTQNRILEIIDNTGAEVLQRLGNVRQEFFSGISGFIVEAEERDKFNNMFLNKPMTEAFQRGETECKQKLLIKLPNEQLARWVQFKVNLVKMPDNGDLVGILTVTDITEQTMVDQIMRRLSVSDYDYVADLDLNQDSYYLLSDGNEGVANTRPHHSFSQYVDNMAQSKVVPRDRERYASALNLEEIRRRLSNEPSYSLSFSTTDQKGDICAKNVVISGIDMRIGRACIACNDITDSVREQQVLLNMMARTFELVAFIRVDIQTLTLYKRETVLENLPPLIVNNYGLKSAHNVAKSYGFSEMDGEVDVEVERQLRLETLQAHLSEKPNGYSFVLPYRLTSEVRHKQINVFWGDSDHSTICLVRADVTDTLAREHQAKKALENALAQAKRANNAKTDFLSSMSHDIRTPMNAIIWMTALATANLDDRSKLEDCLQKISFSSKHLLNLINDILDMSKIERAQLALNHELISIDELINQLKGMIVPQAEAAGLKVNIYSENVRHVEFYGDSLRINQILINILGNAIKFTPRQGEVELCVEELDNSEAAGRARYRFSISDTGIGMSPDFLTQLFEPFTRNDNAAHIEGTGLGLSITKGLVDAMGGTISVSSMPDKGTTFQVELEAEIATGQESMQAKPLSESNEWLDKHAFNARHFLIAEDNAINSEILCELLKMHGASSFATANGAEAVREFQAAAPGTYDAILMDVQMPIMDGYTATRRIRALNVKEARTIPIIAMTANAFAEDIDASMKAGMSAHVAKPIDIKMLIAALNAVFDDGE